MTPILAHANCRWSQIRQDEIRRGKGRGGHGHRWLGWARQRNLSRSPQPRGERACRPDLLDTVLGGQITEDDGLEVPVSRRE